MALLSFTVPAAETADIEPFVKARRDRALRDFENANGRRGGGASKETVDTLVKSTLWLQFNGAAKDTGLTPAQTKQISDLVKSYRDKDVSQVLHARGIPS